MAASPLLVSPSSPDAAGQETRGTGSNTRHVRNILHDTAEAESLPVVEVVTPAGNGSSNPPHKHDRDALPDESLLEQTYYHRLDPPQGCGMQRVYTDDRSLDGTVSFADRDVVLVPRGYHPAGAPHGYDLFHLDVMAGPKRIWHFHNDPARGDAAMSAGHGRPDRIAIGLDQGRRSPRRRGRSAPRPG